MKSIRELFRIGLGPSSSHTMGPRSAALIFQKRFPDAGFYRLTLYGSLAATGRGHMTDKAVLSVFESGKLEIIWKPQEFLPEHPNGMYFEAFSTSGKLLGDWKVYSVGGGALLDSESLSLSPQVYPQTTMKEILTDCKQSGQALWEYVEEHEGEAIWDYLNQVWKVMQKAIENGLSAEGVLPGGLGLARKACSLNRKANLSGEYLKQHGVLASYALAVAEQNASGGEIVTAPTCGSCGVVPAVLRFEQEILHCSDQSISRALATAGLIGNLAKHNASISGAAVGCQGEIGVACAMAAAAVTQLLGGTIRQVEYAAEMGLEHHLGLTCDPVGGLVQIPCIERNAFAASQAISCANYALFTDGSHRVSYDEVLAVMKETGQALPSLYRETSAGGLATIYRTPKKNS